MPSLVLFCHSFGYAFTRALCMFPPLSLSLPRCTHSPSLACARTHTLSTSQTYTYSLFSTHAHARAQIVCLVTGGKVGQPVAVAVSRERQASPAPIRTVP